MKVSFKSIKEKINFKKTNKIIHAGLGLVAGVGVHYLVKSVYKPILVNQKPWKKVAIAIGAYYMTTVISEAIDMKLEEQRDSVDKVYGMVKDVKEVHDETGKSYLEIIKLIYKVAEEQVDQEEKESTSKPAPRKEAKKENLVFPDDVSDETKEAFLNSFNSMYDNQRSDRK